MPTAHARHPHALTERIVARQLARRQRTLELLATRTDLTSTVLEISIRDGVALAAVVSLFDTTDMRLIDGLRASARAGAAMFAALGAAGPVEVEIAAGQSRTIEAIAPDEDTGVLPWRRAFFAAFCVGDRASLDAIANVSIEALKRSPRRSPDFMYSEIEALSAVHRGAADTTERLTAALRATDPEGLDAFLRDLVLDVVVPELELFYRALRDDPASFNESLAKSLTGHRHFHGRGDNARDPIGQLAFGPLAAACLANDRGMEVTVESDYIPRSVIEYPRR